MTSSNHDTLSYRFTALPDVSMRNGRTMHRSARCG